MAFEPEKRKLLDAAPEYISTLIGADFFHCEVNNAPIGPDAPPAIAWTFYNEQRKRWEITFRPEAAQLSFDAREALWRHEIGHIAFAHFGKQTCNPDDPIRSHTEQLQVGDIQINTYLLDNPSLMDEIGKLNNELIARLTDTEVDPENSGYLDPRIILPEIGLSVQPYSYDVIHAYLHQKMDEEGGGQNWTQQALQNYCAGILNADDIKPGSEGELMAGIVATVSDYGTEPGMGDVRLRESELPTWIDALESFARSVVEVVMADTRSHTRPQEIYKAYDVHMPTMRPRWAYKANQVCFLVDTSGSMMHELRYVMPVVQYLLQHEISVRMIAGDTRVTYDELLRPGVPLPEGIGGGGGTEITPLFDRAKDYDPKSIVCFTDGYVARWPQDEGIPTLWVGTQTDVPYGTKA